MSGQEVPGSGTAGVPALSAVLVTFHSSAQCPGAVASLRESARQAGLSLEVILVDHSEDAAEVERLRALRPDVLVTQENRGFAAGVNAGLAKASAPRLVVANPDVELDGPALGHLAAALVDGWGVVAPQMQLGDFLFPPADLCTPGERLRRWLASRSPRLWRRQVLAEVGRSQAVWEARRTVPVRTLSGGLLLLAREHAARVGPWDEGYFLYFEETDWLRRATRAGVRIGLEPRARAQHLWGHAADPGTMTAVYERSERRFLAAHHGLAGRLVATLRGTGAPAPPPVLPEEGLSDPGRRWWWLLSASTLALPAAGLLGTLAELRAALLALEGASLRCRRYQVVAVDRKVQRVEGPWRWEFGPS